MAEKRSHPVYGIITVDELKRIQSKKGQSGMTADVKRVSTSLKGMMDAIKKEVDAAEAEVVAAQDETIMAVGMTRSMVRGLRDDVADLRALLGGATNNPPEG
jgi:Mg2+ and Co2+ transporter CorA